MNLWCNKIFFLFSIQFALSTFCVVTIVYGQQHQQTTPIPILKQINRQNDDGSYSYGYEGADGSFKIETKFSNGEVQGKYGYIDVDSGKLREIEYGASRRGFEPQGTDINVPPPTVNNNNNINPLGPNEEDDGQYREDPNIYNDPKYNSKPAGPATAHRFQNQKPQQNYQQPQQQQQQYYSNPAPKQQYFQPQQQQYNEEPVYQDQPIPQARYLAPTQQYYNQPQYQNQNEQFNGHPATNFDINTGSYSVSYIG